MINIIKMGIISKLLTCFRPQLLLKRKSNKYKAFRNFEDAPDSETDAIVPKKAKSETKKVSFKFEEVKVIVHKVEEAKNEKGQVQKNEAVADDKTTTTPTEVNVNKDGSIAIEQKNEAEPAKASTSKTCQVSKVPRSLPVNIHKNPPTFYTKDDENNLSIKWSRVIASADEEARKKKEQKSQLTIETYP